jgi:hypothetical protein
MQLGGTKCGTRSEVSIFPRDWHQSLLGSRPRNQLGMSTLWARTATDEMVDRLLAALSG